ncbi:MAG: AMP-binding enzyme [Promethearchaeota archaeon]
MGRIPGAIMIVNCDEDTNELFKDENGFLIPCKPGETGMMLAVILENEYFQGYKDKAKTNKRVITNAFVEGDIYFNTGDLVTLHEDSWVSFADRSGDTFRWKGENVSTLEVESILNTFLPVEMCTVYGVEIPNTDGKAGMACLKLNNEVSFDVVKFSRFVQKNFPKYSIPIFIRIKDELEFTGTHKLRKVNLRKQGYDLNTLTDKIYFWDPPSNNYILLDTERYQNLLEGKIKL